MPTINLTGKGAGPSLQQSRIQIAADDAARMEYSLRKLLNDRSLREERRLERDKLREIERANREGLREEKRLAREKLQEERRQQREQAQLERERIRTQNRQERDAQRRKDEFWRGLGLAGLAGTITGGGSFRGIAGGAAGVAAYGISSALGAGAKAGIIAEAIGEAVKLAINPYAAFYGGAKPFYDYQRQAFMLGRAGGRGMESIAGQFFYGGYRGPSWMSKLDMSPQEAIQALSALGVVPQGDYGSLAHTLAVGRLLPGFAGLGMGAVTGAASQGLGYGAAAPNTGGVQGYLTPIAQMLADASAAGMDRSKLLSSMESSLDTISKSGNLGISSGAITSLMMRMAAGGTPAGLSGQLTAQTVSGITGNLQNILGNPLATTLLTSQLGRFGNLRTAADVRGFVGERNWSAAPPALRNAIVGQITQAAREGNFPAALDLISANLMGADPTRLMDILGPTMGMVTGGRSYLAPRLLSGATGAPLQAAEMQLFTGGASQLDLGLARYNGIGFNLSHGMPYPKNIAATYSRMFGGSLSAAFDPKADYAKRLASAGVPGKLISLFIAAGKKDQINPMLLAAIGKWESAGKWDKMGLGPTGDYGIMQISPDNQKRFPNFRSPAGNIQAGADILRWALRKSAAGTEGVDWSGAGLNVPGGTARVGKELGDLTEAAAAARTLIPLASGLTSIAKSTIDALHMLDKGIRGLSFINPAFRYGIMP